MEELNILNLFIILIAAWIGGSAAKKLGYPAWRTGNRNCFRSCINRVCSEKLWELQGIHPSRGKSDLPGTNRKKKVSFLKRNTGLKGFSNLQCKIKRERYYEIIPN